MADRDVAKSKPSKRNPSSEVQPYRRSVPLSLNIVVMAKKSAKVAALLHDNPSQDLTSLLRNIPANFDPEIFELVARFCHGFEIDFLSTENVIPITCLADFLEMTESHSKNNLIKCALFFFEQRVLPSWNETIKALRSVGCLLEQAYKLGLVGACVESIIEKALLDPGLLGDPIKNSASDENSEGKEEECRPNTRRRLFVLDWKEEDLAALPLQLYEHTIRSMYQREVPQKYMAVSLCQYVKKWVLSTGKEEENMSTYTKNSQRDVLEAMEKFMPDQEGLIPSTLLFQMLQSAIFLEVSDECRNGLESRIGKQLEQATVTDLLIPSQGYTKKLQYDIECVKRILTHYYNKYNSSFLEGNNYNSSDTYGFALVADLIEEFLVEISSDIDLKIDTFVSLAEVSKAASIGTNKNADGIYRAINIYLEKHTLLTQVEKEEVCKVLECNKMSPEACEHASRNNRLPVRLVVQVLFATQLQLRDVVTHVLDDKLRRAKPEAEEDAASEGKAGFDEEEVIDDLEKMSIKVMELEKECMVIKKEIESGCNHHKVKKEKVSMWTEMKRKFGCMRNVHDCNCQVKRKKVHPRY